METVVRNYRDRWENAALVMMSNCTNFLQEVSNTREEEHRRLKSIEDLGKKMAEKEAQEALTAVEQAKIQEEKKKISKKEAEANAKLKLETIKADELKLVADREQARLEEKDQLSKNIQDKIDMYLKPYHEILGVTFQLSKGPDVSLRFLFQMPNGKKCVVKMAKDGFKIIKCVPMLKDLDKLVANLRETNDFPGFVFHLRRMFLNVAAQSF